MFDFILKKLAKGSTSLVLLSREDYEELIKKSLEERIVEKEVVKLEIKEKIRYIELDYSIEKLMSMLFNKVNGVKLSLSLVESDIPDIFHGLSEEEIKARKSELAQLGGNRTLNTLVEAYVNFWGNQAVKMVNGDPNFYLTRGYILGLLSFWSIFTIEHDLLVAINRKAQEESQEENFDRNEPI
jgi:hypothetical protein